MHACKTISYVCYNYYYYYYHQEYNHYTLKLLPRGVYGLIDDETYDEIAVKTVSKCLVCMEEVVGTQNLNLARRDHDEIILLHVATLSVSFLWRACTLGIFPY